MFITFRSNLKPEVAFRNRGFGLTKPCADINSTLLLCVVRNSLLKSRPEGFMVGLYSGKVIIRSRDMLADQLLPVAPRVVTRQLTGLSESVVE